MSSGGILTSRFRQCIGVVKYAPATVRRYRDCLVSRRLAIPFGSPLRDGVYQAEAPYVIVLRTTFVYSSRAREMLTPYTDAASFVRANCYVASLAVIFLRCRDYRSFLSSQTPRNFADSTGLIALPKRRTFCWGAAWAREKYVNSLFSEANVIPLVRAQFSQVIQALSSRLQFAIISLLYVIRFVSSTKPTT